MMSTEVHKEFIGRVQALVDEGGADDVLTALLHIFEHRAVTGPLEDRAAYTLRAGSIRVLLSRETKR